MGAKITERQSQMLAALRALPARYRLHGKARYPLKIEVLENYDARIWQGLVLKGLLKFTPNGFRV